MSIDPLQIVLKQLDRIERQQELMLRRLDDKIDYRSFEEFKKRTEESMAHVEKSIEEINRAAVTPDQVTTMVGKGLQDSQARGITAKDRWIRWSVAAVSVATFTLLAYERATA